MATVYILSSEKQTGKTTFLKEWSKEKENIQGILTPINLNGKREFYNIATKDFFPMEISNEEEESLQVGKFNFSKNNFEKASTQINNACKQNPNFLIIDEIGPLEIIQQKGFYTTLIQVLANISHKTILILVARPSCVESINNILSESNHISFIFDIPAIAKKLK